MSTLHRTQIYIEAEQMHQLKFEAEKEHLSISELIRRSIRYLLEAKKKNVNWEGDSLTKTVGKIKLSINDASVGHDHYLYSSRKRK